MKIIRFKGRFRDLIPGGFRFFKLFARNYRCYQWSEKEHETALWIWQHRGGYVEVGDFFSASHVFVEAIQSGVLDRITSGNHIQTYWAVLNKLNNTLHDAFRDEEYLKDRKEMCYQIGREDHEFDPDLMKAFYAKWRDAGISFAFADKLREMLAKDLIEVVTVK